jgi:uncharacterized protein YggE
MRTPDEASARFTRSLHTLGLSLVAAALVAAPTARPIRAALIQTPGGALIVPPEATDDPTVRRTWADILIAPQDLTAGSVIVVTGRAQVDAEPDRARIFLAVETEGSTAGEASAENAERMTAVSEAVRSAGQDIGELQIGTSGYSLNPVYAPAGPDRAREIVGYTARNTLRVTLDEIDQVGELIDAALGGGANRVSGLRFEVRDSEPYRAEALRQAVAAARGEAAIMAEALGMTLGSPLEVEGGADVPFPTPLFQSGAERALAVQAAPTPIEAEMQNISARVTIRFRLEPGP